jgi:hypothetical protein
MVLTSDSSSDSARAFRVSSPSRVSARHVRGGAVHEHVGSQALLIQFLFVDIVPLGLEEVRICNELFLVQVLLLFLIQSLGELIRDLAKRRAKVHFRTSLVREIILDTRFKVNLQIRQVSLIERTKAHSKTLVD